MDEHKEHVLPIKSKKRVDYASLWSKYAGRKHPFNRMDPDSDGESIPTPEQSRPNTKTKRSERLSEMQTREYWKHFWAQRMRNFVNAPNLTDKDISDIVERHRRIYFLRKAESERRIDSDLPPCYYWDKFQVSEWATSVGISTDVKNMLLSSDICGRTLITVDANNLLKMGLYDLNMIKTVTKAVRKVLGLPPPNGIRAVARFVPLERFLKMKVRTGSEMNALTFKAFCEQEDIDYDAAKREMLRGYLAIPDTCKVVIKPDKREKVIWIPVKQQQLKPPKGVRSDTDSRMSESDSTSSSDSSLLGMAPTVEQLANSVLLRNTLIPQILNDMVEAVFKKIVENRKNKGSDKKQAKEAAKQVIKGHMEQAYSDFSIVDPEEKLKFVTIIAEELVDDVLRARDILEDIDEFQTRVQKEMSESEKTELQQAVAHYVQNIMPVVVSVALKEMEESSTALHSELDTGNTRFRGDNPAPDTVTLFHRDHMQRNKTSNRDPEMRSR